LIAFFNTATNVRMSKYILSFLLLTITHYISGQNRIQGCITDEQTGKVLPYALIRTTAGDEGGVAEENGCFDFTVKTLPVEIEISLVGYENKKLKVTTSSILRIQLKQATYMMNQVEITDFSFERVAGNTTRSIWDYAWLDGQLLLCEYGTSLSRSRMILITTEGDTLAMNNAPGRSFAMFNDCMNKAYLLSKDSLWEYFLEKDELKYFPAESAILAERVLQYCVGVNEASIYFAIPSGAELRLGQDPIAMKYKTHNDKMQYYRFDKAMDKLMAFESVEDEFVQKLKKDEIEYGDGPQPRPPIDSHSYAASKVFFYQIMCKEIDAPMYYLNDSLYILDHTNEELKVYSQSGTFIRHLPMTHHLIPHYNRESICDEMRQNIYVVYETNGIYTLKKLDTNNASVGSGITIPHLFPEHITITDNYIYYIHRDEKVHEAHVLSRLKIN
jgi:hypothetical protein